MTTADNDSIFILNFQTLNTVKNHDEDREELKPLSESRRLVQGGSRKLFRITSELCAELSVGITGTSRYRS